ncbi:MAG: hypothetical protein HWD63_09720 [Candidatus Parvibacillus calidus]|nr:MAG: hypothetical protein HWD63_09720 [Candidatus Parvibacillus calidus]
MPSANALIAMTKIDPQEETATFEYNTFKGLGQKIPLRVSENSTRSDYIVLEAVKFPGINFFWLTNDDDGRPCLEYSSNI